MLKCTVSRLYLVDIPGGGLGFDGWVRELLEE
jgi:hypothetical protein